MSTLQHLIQGCKHNADVDLALLNGIVEQGGNLQSIRNTGHSVVFGLCSLIQDFREVCDEFFFVVRKMDAHNVGSIFSVRGFAPFAVQKLIEKVYDDNCAKLGLPAVKYWCLGNQIDSGPYQTMPDSSMYAHILHACFLIGRSNDITDQELNLMLGCTQSVEQSPVLQDLVRMTLEYDEDTYETCEASANWNWHMMSTLVAAVEMTDDSPHSIVALSIRAPELVAQCSHRLVVWDGVSLCVMEPSASGLTCISVSLKQFKHHVTKIVTLATDEQYIAILCQTKSKEHRRKRGYCIMLYNTDKATLERMLMSPDLTSLLHSGAKEASLCLYVNGTFVTAGVCKNKDVILLSMNIEAQQEQSMFIEAPWFVSTCSIHDGDLMVASKNSDAVAKMELSTVMMSGPSYHWKTLGLSHQSPCRRLCWIADGRVIAVGGSERTIWIDVIDFEAFEKQHSVEVDGSIGDVLVSSANERDFLVSVGPQSICCNLPENPMHPVETSIFTAQEAYWYCRESQQLLSLQLIACEEPLNRDLYAWKQVNAELEAGVLSDVSQRMSARPIQPTQMGVPKPFTGPDIRHHGRDFSKDAQEMDDINFWWFCKNGGLNRDQVLELFVGWLMKYRVLVIYIKLRNKTTNIEPIYDLTNSEIWGEFWYNVWNSKDYDYNLETSIKDAEKPYIFKKSGKYYGQSTMEDLAKLVEKLRSTDTEKEWKDILGNSGLALKYYIAYREYLTADVSTGTKRRSEGADSQSQVPRTDQEDTQEDSQEDQEDPQEEMDQDPQEDPDVVENKEAWEKFMHTFGDLVREGLGTKWRPQMLKKWLAPHPDKLKEPDRDQRIVWELFSGPFKKIYQMNTIETRYDRNLATHASDVSKILSVLPEPNCTDSWSGCWDIQFHLFFRVLKAIIDSNTSRVDRWYHILGIVLNERLIQLLISIKFFEPNLDIGWYKHHLESAFNLFLDQKTDTRIHVAYFILEPSMQYGENSTKKGERGNIIKDWESKKEYHPQKVRLWDNYVSKLLPALRDNIVKRWHEERARWSKKLQDEWEQWRTEGKSNRTGARGGKRKPQYSTEYGELYLWTFDQLFDSTGFPSLDDTTETEGMDAINEDVQSEQQQEQSKEEEQQNKYAWNETLWFEWCSGKYYNNEGESLGFGMDFSQWETKFDNELKQAVPYPNSPMVPEQKMIWKLFSGPFKNILKEYLDKNERADYSSILKENASVVSEILNQSLHVAQQPYENDIQFNLFTYMFNKLTHMYSNNKYVYLAWCFLLGVIFDERLLQLMMKATNKDEPVLDHITKTQANRFRSHLHHINGQCLYQETNTRIHALHFILNPHQAFFEMSIKRDLSDNTKLLGFRKDFFEEWVKNQQSHPKQVGMQEYIQQLPPITKSIFLRKWVDVKTLVDHNITVASVTATITSEDRTKKIMELAENRDIRNTNDLSFIHMWIAHQLFDWHSLERIDIKGIQGNLYFSTNNIDSYQTYISTRGSTLVSLMEKLDTDRVADTPLDKGNGTLLRFLIEIKRVCTLSPEILTESENLLWVNTTNDMDDTREHLAVKALKEINDDKTSTPLLMQRVVALLINKPTLERMIKFNRRAFTYEIHQQFIERAEEEEHERIRKYGVSLEGIEKCMSGVPKDYNQTLPMLFVVYLYYTRQNIIQIVERLGNNKDLNVYSTKTVVGEPYDQMLKTLSLRDKVFEKLDKIYVMEAMKKQFIMSDNKIN